MVYSKNYSIQISALAIIFFLYNGAFAIGGSLAGAGTESNPYQIADYEDLKVVKGNLFAHYRLVSNINATASRTENEGKGFEPIGRLHNYQFRGSFNGAGYVISGLYINRPTYSYIGLFGRLYGADIDSLGVRGEITGGMNTGGIVGYAVDSRVTASYVTGSVIGSRNVGGIVGHLGSSSIVTHCYSTSSVKGDNDIGGFVGIVGNTSVINNSYSAGVVTGSKNVGGFVGGLGLGTLNGCYWNQQSVLQSSSKGGLALSTSQMLHDSSYATWDFSSVWEISVGSSLPGLRGVNDAPFSIFDSFDSVPETLDFTPFISNDIDLDGGDVIATVAQFLERSVTNELRDSLYIFYRSGIVESPNDTIWLGATYVAVPYDTIFISNYDELKQIGSHWKYPLGGNYRLTDNIDASLSKTENDTNGFNPIGTENSPFIGSFNGVGHVISGLYINRPFENHVGLFGYLDHASIDSLGLRGVVNGDNNTGGLVGTLVSSLISTSYVVGSVTGSEYVGGFVGHVQYSSIRNSYGTGRIRGDEFVGGFAGLMMDSSIISNSYTNSSVDGNSVTGSFIGRAVNTRINQCYYNKETSRQYGYSSGKELTSSKMLQDSSYIGWDFEAVWEIMPGVSYPGLRGINDAPFGIPNSFDSLPDALDFTPFVTNDIDIDAGDGLVSVAQFLEYSQTNNLGDSLYLFYRPGIVNQMQDTLWVADTYVAVPYDTAVYISNYNELTLIGNHWKYPLKGRYRLTADIDASASRTENGGLGFKPIGTEDRPFGGSFNGAGYVISGLYINRSSKSYNPSNNFIGLFGSLKNATIENLGVMGEVKGNSWVGSIAGGVYSSIIKNCFSSVNIMGQRDTGGLVGFLEESSTLSSSYSTGSIIGDRYTGGLVGFATDYSTLTSSYSTARVSGTEYVGGLVGFVHSSIKINDSFSTGSVNGVSYVGGLIGIDPPSMSMNNYWNKETSGQYGLSTAAEALTTEQMHQMHSYSHWDFVDEWHILSGKSYPGLQSVNNAPMAFRDSILVNRIVSLDSLLLNDYDLENYKDSLVILIDTLLGIGETDFATWFSFPQNSIPGTADSVMYRVGEKLTSGEILWGNQAVAVFILDSSNRVPTLSIIDSQFITSDSILVVDLAMTDANDFDGDILEILLDDGSDYTIIGDTLTPDIGFAGTLTVPVRVTDGIDTSDAIPMVIIVSNSSGISSSSFSSSSSANSSSSFSSSSAANSSSSFSSSSSANSSSVFSSNSSEISSSVFSSNSSEISSSSFSSSSFVSSSSSEISSSSFSSSSSVRSDSSFNSSPSEYYGSSTNISSIVNTTTYHFSSNNMILKQSSSQEEHAINDHESSQQNSSMFQSPITIGTGSNNEWTRLIISSTGNSEITLDVPESLQHYEVYSVHGILVQRGLVRNGMVQILRDIPQGVLYIKLQ